MVIDLVSIVKVLGSVAVFVLFVWIAISGCKTNSEHHGKDGSSGSDSVKKG